MTEEEKRQYKEYVQTGMTPIYGVVANGPSGKDLEAVIKNDPRYGINRDLTPEARARGVKFPHEIPENNFLDIDKVVPSDAKKIVQEIEEEELNTKQPKITRRKPRTNVKGISKKGNTLAAMQEQIAKLEALLAEKDREINSLQEALDELES